MADLQVGCLETSRVGGFDIHSCRLPGRRFADLQLGSLETSRLDVWKALARRFGDFQVGVLSPTYWRFGELMTSMELQFGDLQESILYDTIRRFEEFLISSEGREAFGDYQVLALGDLQVKPSEGGF